MKDFSKYTAKGRRETDYSDLYARAPHLAPDGKMRLRSRAAAYAPWVNNPFYNSDGGTGDVSDE